MRKFRIIATFTAFVSLAALSAPASSQTLPESPAEVELTRDQIQANRETIVTQAIDLTPEESKAFWPLYRDWRAKMTALGDSRVTLINRIRDDYDRLSDAECKALLDEWVNTEREDLKLKEHYIQKFRKIIPEKKVARFFQLENKLDAVVSYNLAGSLPLVE